MIQLNVTQLSNLEPLIEEAKSAAPTRPWKETKDILGRMQHSFAFGGFVLVDNVEAPKMMAWVVMSPSPLTEELFAMFCLPVITKELRGKGNLKVMIDEVKSVVKQTAATSLMFGQAVSDHDEFMVREGFEKFETHWRFT